MKNIFKILALAVTTVVMVTACTKVADLPYYENGNAVTLTANKTAVTAVPADSLNQVITFSWTNPEQTGQFPVQVCPGDRLHRTELCQKSHESGDRRFRNRTHW